MAHSACPNPHQLARADPRGAFWAIYGEHDEVCFPFHASRSADFVCQALGLKPAVNAVLLTDGYAANAQYAEKIGVAHARCWSHAHRGLFEAMTAEPTGATEALEQVKTLSNARCV